MLARGDGADGADDGRRPAGRGAEVVLDGGLDPPLSLRVYEVADDAWWTAATADQNPYGARLWPGAVAAAARVAALPAVRRGASVLELGCGVGLASCAAARAGASRALATDVAPLALALAAAAAAEQRLGAVETAAFDVCGPAKLPDADVVVIADLLYDDELAAHAARRVLEARARGSAVVVGGDPARVARAAFLERLREGQGEGGDDALAFEPPYSICVPSVKWKSKRVEVMHIPARDAG